MRSSIINLQPCCELDLKLQAQNIENIWCRELIKFLIIIAVNSEGPMIIIALNSEHSDCTL